MSELKKSDFQMRGFHIQSIHFSARTPELSCDDFTSSVSVSKDVEYRSDLVSWLGFILLRLKLLPKEGHKDPEQPEMLFSCVFGAIFTLEAEETDEAEQEFERFLKLNGMVSTLSAARANLIQLSMQLGISPPIIVPNIDLREFEWSKEDQLEE